jgi:hypothetical protein
VPRGTLSSSSSRLLPTCNSPFAGYCRSFLRREFGCSSFAASIATFAPTGYGLRAPQVRRGRFQRATVHVFAYGLFDD